VKPVAHHHLGWEGGQPPTALFRARGPTRTEGARGSGGAPGKREASQDVRWPGLASGISLGGNGLQWQHSLESGRMSHLRYDENVNVRRLAKLPRSHKVAFALLAAGRILPTYARFHARTGRGDAVALQGLVDRLWRDLLGETMTEDEVERATQMALNLVPSDDDGWAEQSQAYAESAAYAEDASAAVAYAFRARITDDPQEAAWAGRRVFEAADQYAAAMSGIAPGSRDGGEVIAAQPTVQTELTRQARDLDELAEVARVGRDAPSLLEMRWRSERESESFFGESV
jgi:hypothetical protein